MKEILLTKTNANRISGIIRKAKDLQKEEKDFIFYLTRVKLKASNQRNIVVAWEKNHSQENTEAIMRTEEFKNTLLFWTETKFKKISDLRSLICNQKKVITKEMYEFRSEEEVELKFQMPENLIDIVEWFSFLLPDARTKQGKRSYSFA
jgi:hypothetical protein